MDRIINVDLEKYIIYENLENNNLVACEMKHQSRLIELYKKYDNFKTAPDSESIEIFILQYDNKTNSYFLNHDFKETIKVNQLKGTMVGIYK